MNEITIAVKYDNDNPTVSGRELHDVLGVQTAYKDWFPRLCGYGFVEGRDFNPLKIERVQNEGSAVQLKLPGQYRQWKHGSMQPHGESCYSQSFQKRQKSF